MGPFRVETVAVLAPRGVLGATAVTTSRLGAVDARRDPLAASARVLAPSLAGIDPSGSVAELTAARRRALAS